MFGDTHLDNDTLEVSPEEDLLTMEDAEDEDLEVTISGDEEDEAGDANPQQEPTAEGNEQNPKDQQPEGEVFTLKYKGQESQYSREQVLELASKGLDYDGLRADRDRLRDNHPALEIIDRYARQNNMTREQYLAFAREKADEAEAAPEIRKLMDSGVPEAAARELALRRLQAQRGAQEQQLQESRRQEEQNRAQAEEAQKQADFRALVDYAKANGVELKELPQEVLVNIARKGMKPLEAYLQYENAQLRQQNSQLTQNQKNQKKNPGRISDDKPAVVKDPFDDAFDEIFGLG